MTELALNLSHLLYDPPSPITLIRAHTYTHSGDDDDAVAAPLMRFGSTGAPFLLNALKSFLPCAPMPTFPLNTLLSNHLHAFRHKLLVWGV